MVMTTDEIRSSIHKQLASPLLRLAELKRERLVLAEQRERVNYGERCLWGASVVMSVVGLTQRHRPQPGEPLDELEHQWWYLYDLLEEIRATWPWDEREAYDADRSKRRQEVYDFVMAKLAEKGIMEVHAPYAIEDQRQHDEWPTIKYDLDVRYADEMGWLRVRDPFTGEWHEIEAKDAPFGWRKIAREHKQKTGKKR